jgi:Ax21 family sulfation-dependent quorum factor
MEFTRMKRTFAISALALALAAASSAGAADLSYTYLEAGRTWYDIDGGADADGWAAQGSVALGSQFHLYGGYGSNEIDHTSIDVDVTRLGLGWNRSINDTSDLVVRANWVNLDSNFPDSDTDGYEAEVGLRSGWTPNFETYLAGGYVDVDRGDGDGDFYAKAGAQYKFNQNWGIAASASFADDNNEYFIGPRFSF